ncbi:MAG TPA: FliI/YscN family ATPase [Polyangiaceae bacterium]
MPTLRPVGRVVGVTGLLLRVALPGARVADLVLVRRRGAALPAEIVGFREGEALALPLGDLSGVGPDDEVEATGGRFEIEVGPELVGRVLDGLGRPLDGRPPPRGQPRAVDCDPPPALGRRPVSEVFSTGVRAIDAFATLGVGQRIGLFAGSGVGKSTLLGAIARGASAEVVVVALVGERGREVSEFLERSLGERGRARSVVIAATSDAPPVERLRAAQVATSVAESFRDAGKNVLLLVDSVTRVARAQREIGLAAGEPPARRGYPPSVFTLLPRLLERSGQGERGAITAIYTVLVEGGDMDEPIADEVRGILDGHVVLERAIAERGQYPAIDVTASLSRVMEQVTDAEHVRAARGLRALLAAYEEKRDLVSLGAYAAGSDARLDQAIRALPELERFLRQEPAESETFSATLEQLRQLAQKHAPSRR